MTAGRRQIKSLPTRLFLTGVALLAMTALCKAGNGPETIFKNNPVDSTRDAAWRKTEGIAMGGDSLMVEKKPAKKTPITLDVTPTVLT